MNYEQQYKNLISLNVNNKPKDFFGQSQLNVEEELMSLKKRVAYLEAANQNKSQIKFRRERDNE